MRVVDIRETAILLTSDLRNASFDFSEMTTSIVAVITPPRLMATQLQLAKDRSGFT